MYRDIGREMNRKLDRDVQEAKERCTGRCRTRVCAGFPVKLAKCGNCRLVTGKQHHI